MAWSNYADHTLNVNVSTDGGKTFGKTDGLIHKWTAPTGTGLDIKIPADPQRGVTVFPFIDVDRSNGPNRGTLYCVYNDGDTTAGLSAFLTKSSDGGKTWTQPLKVNDDTATGRRDHFMPRVAVDQSDGSVNVVWYDTRNDAKNTKTDVFYARSTDGGKTFEPNVKVTTAQSDESGGALTPPGGGGVHSLGTVDPTIRGGVHAQTQSGDGKGPIRTTDEVLNSDANGYGDYLGITADKGHVHPLWTDSRAGNQAEDAYTADIVNGQVQPPLPKTPVQGSASPNAPFGGGKSAASTLRLDGTATVGSLQIDLDLVHTRARGLTATLTSPSGKSMTVPLTQAKQVKASFDVSKGFAGEPVQGDWTLTVGDTSKTDTGTLNAWSLKATPA